MKRHLMYVNIFRFCTLTFLPMTDVSMQKWNNSLRLHVTSGLGIHSFERVVGFLTQNYNQNLLQHWTGASVLKRQAFVLDD